MYRFADVMRLAAVGNQEHDWEVCRLDITGSGNLTCTSSTTCWPKTANPMCTLRSACRAALTL